MENFIERDTSNFWNVTKLLDYYMLGHKGFISGGCFKNILEGNKIKDIDIFFESNEDFQGAVSYFTTQVTQGKFSVGYSNDKVTSFIDVRNHIRIELVKSVFGTPLEILKGFDFTITKFSYFKKLVDDFDEDGLPEQIIQYTILHHKDYFEHLQTKRLVIDDNLDFPLSSWERSYKYRDYGYKLCRESKIKLVQSIIDLEDFTEDMLLQGFYTGKD